jgi:predicted DCC family thiol-disulfide oxidoreductase YuxK
MSVVLFDGNCGLCNRSVQFILKFEKRNDLKFASLDSDFAKNVLLKFRLEKDYHESILLVKKEKIFAKSTAVLRIIPFLKWYFYPLLIGWILPRFIRDLVYDFVAANRKRFLRNCIHLDEKNKNRFLY